MSIDMEPKIKNSPLLTPMDIEADKNIEKWLVHANRFLNRSKHKIGTAISNKVLQISKYNLIPTILSSIIFSYLALNDDIKASVRRLTPAPVRAIIIESFSVNSITLTLAVSAIVMATWVLCSNSISDIILKRQNKRLAHEIEILRRQHDSKIIDCTDLFSKFIYSTYRKLKYGVTERISLYVLELDHFRCVGRHSDNEKHTEFPKKMYAKESGLIGHAWTLGNATVTALPDPLLDLESWVAANAHTGKISDATLRAIGMKSRSLHCVRIKNSKSTSVAIIVFESTNSDLPNIKTIDADFGKNESRTIANLLDALRPHMVSLEIAKKAGF
ncbi:hypothetical protein [Pseudomonas sp. TWRC1-2]|uniref:hypothetical protein n=1 Tax=Pseudomonas sp. TWRC1-2 TaxID=2804628 RepID=UPI003CF91497